MPLHWLQQVCLAGWNDNLFNPATIATQGGWNLNGLGFHNLVSGVDLNVYYDSQIFLAYTGNMVGLTNNYTFSSSPVSSVPVPTAVWLFVCQ